MQRRAAAIYVALFLVIGAGAYSLIATAHEPTISFENPEYELKQNDSFEVEGQTYKVTSIKAEAQSSSGGGGHGGGGGGGSGEVTRSGQVSWTNQSARYTANLQNNSTVTVQNTQYRVVIPNASGNPTSFTLREEINESAVLRNDSAADNQTITRDGQRFVVVENEDGNATLVPADEYFPEPSSQQYSENDSLRFQGNQTTVDAVENDSVTLAWTAPRTNTVELSDEGNVTLGGQTYLAQFPDNNTVVLTKDFQSLREQKQEIQEFKKHKNGLWGVIILCGSVVVLLAAMAYLPSRY